LRKRLRDENRDKGIYEHDENQIIETFLHELEAEVKKVSDNRISAADLGDFKKVELDILKVAFQLLPLKTNNIEHKEIAKAIISEFADKLLSGNRDDRLDYRVRHGFLEKLAYFVLSSEKKDIFDYLKPFLDKFNGSEVIADLFREFIIAEDYLDAYDNFLEVWDLFEGKIIDLCKDGDGYWYVEQIVKSYLFAQTLWKEKATEWHTLKDENKGFFKNMMEKIGHCPSAFYSISKLLNDIGSSYLKEGVSWISNTLQVNKGVLTAKLETNTVYYLENLARKYIYENRQEIRKMAKAKAEILVILDFLIEKGSAIGYLLRENIL
jgi:hypothetical protein